jgi:uncharacterized membrane protein
MQDNASTTPPSLASPTIAEKEVLKTLRRRKPARHPAPLRGMTLGERVADVVAAISGSWTFIIAQTTVLFLWLAINAYSGKAWDPYPFILLNLLLSFQAAYAAPIIMMAQNRQADIDRKKAEKDYDVNLKVELEIELLHQKMDLMREQEIKRLTELVEELLQKNRKEKP